MITAADLRVLVGLDAADDSEDAQLLELEAAAVAFVEGQTGWFFGAEEAFEEIVIGDGGPKLRLQSPPKALPATVAERCYPGADATTITAADDDGYELRALRRPNPPVSWLHRKGGCGWACGAEYTVAYTRGYPLSGDGSDEQAWDAPEDVRKLVADIVRFQHAARERDPALISETIGNYSYSTGAVYQAEAAMVHMIPGAAETLARWRRVFA